PKVPNFLETLFRRKLVLWFLASEILRDYWLSGPYGRNWSFLWNVPIPKWAILLLTIFFFVGVWTLMLYILTSLSKTHTWLLPVRCWPWCSEMVSDIVGHLVSCALYPVGWLRGTVPWSFSVALARCFGCCTGCRLRNDSPADVVKITRLFHARSRSGHWVYLCYGRPCNCTKPHRSRERIP
ncbi:hypothetical protein C8R48DRAFT_785676, partial [Suillus tomentosus]